MSKQSNQRYRRELEKRNTSNESQNNASSSCNDQYKNSSSGDNSIMNNASNQKGDANS